MHMDMKNKSTCMTRYDNTTYRAPKLHIRGFVEYFIWKDEFNEKYIQIISKRSSHDISLDQDYYFFSIRQYNHGVFLGNLWGMDRNLEQKKISSVKILFTLKAVLQHYNQLETESKSERY
ncbi:hypothetical protein CTM87_01290 [Photobacterium phosphoreum]|nr:hypothetical protein AYY24_01245 [Photobacterium phosphoreum]PSW38953.1 hypothetical protein CTM87_01290 [Photobacterium phosphoreum]